MAIIDEGMREVYQIYLNGRSEPYATADSLYWVERILDELAEEYVLDYDLSVIECGYVHVQLGTSKK